MSEKKIYGRSVQKHDIQSNWEKATNFIPMVGEIIIYDKDENYSYERLKIGDGIQNVNNLPFVDDAVRTALSQSINSNRIGLHNVDSRVSSLETLVGDVSVSDQIDTAVSQKSQVQIVIWGSDD